MGQRQQQRGVIMQTLQRAVSVVDFIDFMVLL
jgi:hypothetical protein